jgi:hypothetical protein
MEPQTLVYDRARDEEHGPVSGADRGQASGHRHTLRPEVAARREPAPGAFRDDSSRATVTRVDGWTLGQSAHSLRAGWSCGVVSSRITA